MDLNYVYHRQQVSLFMADNAANGAARSVHARLADAYSARIAAARNARRSAEAA